MPRGLEEARDDVEGQERAGMAEVRRVVWGDAADVHREDAAARANRVDRSRSGVVEAEHAPRTISSRAVLRFSMPDERQVIATLERVASPPTVPYHEWRALG